MLHSSSVWPQSKFGKNKKKYGCLNAERASDERQPRLGLHADDMQMACERRLLVGSLPMNPWHASRTKKARERRSIGSTLGLMLRQRSGLADLRAHWPNFYRERL